MPKVSICVPTYRQINDLKNNLESILNQNYEDYEVVITDDTPDKTVEEFVFPYLEKFNGKLKYFKNTKTLGSPKNWNEALRKSTGEYIKVLHHDDWFTKSYSLEKFVHKLEANSDLGIVASFSLAQKANGETKIFDLDEKRIEEINKNPLLLFFGNIIGPPSSILFKRNKFIFFDSNLKWVVDIDFYISLMLSGYKLGIINEELITVSTEGEFKVTNDCLNDIDIVLGEQIYLFNKINNRIIDKVPYINYIHEIMGNYNLDSLRELKHSAYIGDDLKISAVDKIRFNLSRIDGSKRVQRYIENGIKGIIFRINKILPEKPKVYSKLSFSQCGEDLLISFVLMQLRVDNMTYMDIGAHHPKFINNTFLFYKDGATGINIEPDPLLYKTFLTDRPRDINLNIGINDKDYTAVENNDFYIISERSLNTFSSEEAREIEANTPYNIESIKKIETHDINSIFTRYFQHSKLDLLSIDTEGLDFLILKALNFDKFAPKILCVETLTFSASGMGEKRGELIDFIISKGYFVYADTFINTIFVNKDVWDLK